LSLDQRSDLIATFVAMFEGLYAHLPLKRAMYGTDPIQRLRLLDQRAGSFEDIQFHYELARIVTELRDAHTRYVGPRRLADRVAMLPFLVEAYGPTPGSRYVVSRTATDKRLINDTDFKAGVELISWNAVPIDRAVDLYANYETGGRPDSRRARALESLTLRSLQYEPPPDELAVLIGYRDNKGRSREVRIPWRVVKPGLARTSGSATPGLARAIDPAREATRRAKKLMFVPDRWYADRSRNASKAGHQQPPAAGGWIDTTFQDTVSAKVVPLASGRFGYLRLWSFDVNDDRAFVAEVARLLKVLDGAEAKGLIVDLRGNPGGLIWAAERLLQLFSPNQIVPTRFALLATQLTNAMAGAGQNQLDLAPWQPSLEAAVATGELYSQAVPITSEAACNDIGQVYGGPVVAVVDANTYSAGDLFAAGFYDNHVGVLVSVGEATGAGGANVWSAEQVRDSLEGTKYSQALLPAGIDFTIAVRRATRGAGENSGNAIEDVGVAGHLKYSMTKRDLTDSNRDLIEYCADVLSAQPYTKLTVSDREPVSGAIKVTTQGLDRLDVYVDDRPQGSTDISDGTRTVSPPSGWTNVEFRGFASSVLAQRRRL